MARLLGRNISKPIDGMNTTILEALPAITAA
jgi:hypothetical protein